MSQQSTRTPVDGRRGPLPSSRNRSRPRLESLEGRLVLSGIAGLTVSPNLVLNGTPNATITVSASANGSVQVAEGSQSNSFAPGYLKSIAINSGGGTSSIGVYSLPTNVAIQVADLVGGTDNVQVGNGSLSNMVGTVAVSNKSGTTNLTVDDVDDVYLGGDVIGITANSVQLAAHTLVSYGNGVKDLSVLTGSGGETTLFGTAPGVPVTIGSGWGMNEVNIQACSSTVTVRSDMSAGELAQYGMSDDLVTVGNDGSLSGIQGTVNVSNGSGKTALKVDDSDDAYAHSVALTNSSIAFSGVGTINYNNSVGGVDQVELDLGFAPDAVAVASVASYAPITVFGRLGDKFTGSAANQIGISL